MIATDSDPQNVTTTDNPQPTDTLNGASDSSSFQQSAGPEVLNQQRTLQVTETGKPIAAKKQTNATAAVVFVVISSVVLIMIASSVFKWVMKRPEPTPEEKAEADTESEKKPKVEVIRPHKKVPRSKRHK